MSGVRCAGLPAPYDACRQPVCRVVIVSSDHLPRVGAHRRPECRHILLQDPQHHERLFMTHSAATGSGARGVAISCPFCRGCPMRIWPGHSSTCPGLPKRAASGDDGAMMRSVR